MSSSFALSGDFDDHLVDHGGLNPPSSSERLETVRPLPSALQQNQMHSQALRLLSRAESSLCTSGSVLCVATDILLDSSAAAVKVSVFFASA